MADTELQTQAIARRETHKDRTALAREAGLGRLSGLSIVAGTFCAYGLFSILTVVVGGIVTAVGANVDLTVHDWRALGTGGGIFVALVTGISFAFGGYVAGRMARRSGFSHGVALFLSGAVLTTIIGIFVTAIGQSGLLTDQLRSLGLPTSLRDWSDVFTVAGIGTLALMALGSIFGSMRGEHWHTALVKRASDPRFGPEAEAAARAEQAARDAEQARVNLDREHSRHADAPTATPAESPVNQTTTNSETIDLTDTRSDLHRR